MTEAEMQQVQKLVSNGGELFVASSHTGSRKIKVKHGPFKVFTSRFQASDSEVQALKHLLAKVQTDVDAA